MRVIIEVEVAPFVWRKEALAIVPLIHALMACQTVESVIARYEGSEAAIASERKLWKHSS